MDKDIVVRIAKGILVTIMAVRDIGMVPINGKGEGA
jgi:hypothetical protein